MNALTWPTGYPLRLIRYVADEDNRRSIILAQQLGKVIKSSRAPLQETPATHTHLLLSK